MGSARGGAVRRLAGAGRGGIGGRPESGWKAVAHKGWGIRVDPVFWEPAVEGKNVTGLALPLGRSIACAQNRAGVLSEQLARAHRGARKAPADIGQSCLFIKMDPCVRVSACLCASTLCAPRPHPERSARSGWLSRIALREHPSLFPPHA